MNKWKKNYYEKKHVNKINVINAVMMHDQQINNITFGSWEFAQFCATSRKTPPNACWGKKYAFGTHFTVFIENLISSLFFHSTPRCVCVLLLFFFSSAASFFFSPLFNSLSQTVKRSHYLTFTVQTHCFLNSFSQWSMRVRRRNERKTHQIKEQCAEIYLAHRTCKL